MFLLLRPRVLLIPVLFAIALFAGGESAFAIDEAGGPSGEVTPVGEFDMKPVYKGVGTGVGILLIFFVMWFLVYPTVLRSGGVWPVTLFGVTTAVAWLSSWGAGRCSAQRRHHRLRSALYLRRGAG